MACSDMEDKEYQFTGLFLRLTEFFLGGCRFWMPLIVHQELTVINLLILTHFCESSGVSQCLCFRSGCPEVDVC